MMKEKLEEAFKRRDNARDNAIETFVWKGERKTLSDGTYTQEEKLLIDCSQEELQDHYDHCNSMLYSTDRVHPGRKVLLDIIQDQRNRCNAELFVRHIETLEHISRFSFMASLRTFRDNNPSIGLDALVSQTITDLSKEENAEYGNLPIGLILDTCLDKLGKFDRTHITLAFILKQGLWFTPEESKDLTEHTLDGNIRDRKEVVRERLNLRPDINLYTSPKGLSYTQLRAMVTLKSKKYSDLTTIQLETLRNRILFSLEDDVRFHISQWETRKSQIEKVAAFKGYSVG